MNIQLTLENKEYVAVPKDEFEDLMDTIAFDKAMKNIEDDSDLIPSEVVDRLIDSEESTLKIWREFKGLKQKDIVDQTGLEKGYVSKLDNSRNAVMNASLGKVAKLATALDIDIDHLAFEVDEERAATFASTIKPNP